MKIQDNLEKKITKYKSILTTTYRNTYEKELRYETISRNLKTIGHNGILEMKTKLK